MRVDDAKSAVSPEKGGEGDDASTVGRDVFRSEIAALNALADQIDGNFDEAVEKLKLIRGRIIVTGMGKSGHVGRKIAATLASTGSPAFFVHPGEASHGDLGMVMRNDAVIALSASGESAELHDVVEYTKRYQILLIAVTCKPDSVLARSADIVLGLPDMPEACPMNLAPTSSTTMMLVLGDAIAIALLKKRRFTKEDFHLYHPGGKLGQSLIKVRDLMREGEAIPLVPIDSRVSDALIEMSSKSLGCTGVVNGEGALCGVITDGDLRRWVETGETTEQRVEQIMTAKVQSIEAEALGVEALEVMTRKKITNLFICDTQKKPEGIIHIHDCLRAGMK